MLLILLAEWKRWQNLDTKPRTIYSNCRGTLAVGETCDIELLFSPNSIGDLDASLEIEINGNTTFEVYLEGIGILEE